MTTTPFATVEEAVAAFGRGEILVVVDDAQRENEGDLIVAAEFATPDKIAFFLNHTSGVICMPMTGDRLDELELPPMVRENSEAHRTAFTVSTDYRPGTTTGISAADRAATIRALVDPCTAPADLSRPGHVFPLRARPGGVLERPGHTEAAVDLAQLAGLFPGGVIGELVNDDGTMPDREELERFAQDHRLPLVFVADVIAYRRRREKLVRRVASARLPTRHGTFQAHVFESLLTGVQHLAVVHGDVSHGVPLVRVHSECLTGEALGSTRCDCGPQVELALGRIAREGHGVLVYLRGHEGRGLGLGSKLRAYALQDQGLDTVDANILLGFPADARRYGVAAQILRELGVSRLRLMTNNPAKHDGLVSEGLVVTERVPLTTVPTPDNLRYLDAKRRRLGHLLDPGDLSTAFGEAP